MRPVFGWNRNAVTPAAPDPDTGLIKTENIRKSFMRERSALLSPMPSPRLWVTGRPASFNTCLHLVLSSSSMSARGGFRNWETDASFSNAFKSLR